MKKLAYTAVLIAGLAGLTACAGTADQNSVPYGNRTAGHAVMANVNKSEDTTVVDADLTAELAACEERARRLEDMNRSCYRK